MWDDGQCRRSDSKMSSKSSDRHVHARVINCRVTVTSRATPRTSSTSAIAFAGRLFRAAVDDPRYEVRHAARVMGIERATGANRHVDGDGGHRLRFLGEHDGSVREYFPHWSQTVGCGSRHRNLSLFSQYRRHDTQAQAERAQAGRARVSAPPERSRPTEAETSRWYGCSVPDNGGQRRRPAPV